MLPDRSIFKGQKLAESTKIEILKWDILGDFQTMCNTTFDPVDPITWGIHFVMKCKLLESHVFNLYSKQFNGIISICQDPRMTMQ